MDLIGDGRNGGAFLFQGLLLWHLECSVLDALNVRKRTTLGCPSGLIPVISVHTPFTVPEQDADRLAFQTGLIPVPVIPVVAGFNSPHSVSEAALAPTVAFRSIVLRDIQAEHSAPLFILTGLFGIVGFEEILVPAVRNIKTDNQLFIVAILPGICSHLCIEDFCDIPTSGEQLTGRGLFGLVVR